MSRWCSLVSRGFCCLTALGSALVDVLMASHACTSRLTVASFTRQTGLDVDEEGSNFVRYDDVVEEEIGWRVAPPGGTVCWVLGTRDVSCMYRPVTAF